MMLSQTAKPIQDHNVTEWMTAVGSWSSNPQQT